LAQPRNFQKNKRTAQWKKQLLGGAKKKKFKPWAPVKWGSKRKKIGLGNFKKKSRTKYDKENLRRKTWGFSAW